MAPQTRFWTAMASMKSATESLVPVLSVLRKTPTLSHSHTHCQHNARSNEDGDCLLSGVALLLDGISHGGNFQKQFNLQRTYFASKTMPQHYLLGHAGGAINAGTQRILQALWVGFLNLTRDKRSHFAKKFFIFLWKTLD